MTHLPSVSRFTDSVLQKHAPQTPEHRQTQSITAAQMHHTVRRSVLTTLLSKLTKLPLGVVLQSCWYRPVWSVLCA